ncbi:C-5 cytosine-specific DNA methylase [Syntrophobotulus glycolicus DSM 8271]|uniref:DNA (cytosine-5-)-methyltransferase n=1 Tax=Syntrophobotulus glycolicus (strain DSM 8271 / FlGlyR) TaxID=645991 RepID=F0SV01_SYNGF|nr:DNA cytosine methyltransferase [Syntrophobotulus glycolicus]ADY54422.1 C-5 cytosine-specific DNA methylase [Syntrophobotulus glycolicus DSM 8271]
MAGQRAGLAGERSGLFMEQTRIAKEMRKADEQRNVPAHFIRPRYLVWENVPGAFSSADGEDFRAVIEEIVRIKYSACDVPRPESGRWESAGAVILGTEFSLAWRVMDAQFWGVAQRRRRIFLVADFGGTTAPEILFKQDGLFGDIAESGSQGQGAAAPAQGGTDDTGGACLTPWDVQSRRIFEETGTWPSLYGGEGGGHGYIQTEEKTAIAFAANQRDEVRNLQDVAGALGASPGMKQQTFVADAEKISAFHVNQRDEVIDLDGISGALLATRNMQMQTFVTQQPLVCLNDHGGERMDITEEVTPTLRADMGGHPPLISQPNCLNGWDTQQSRVFTPEGVAPTLAGADGGGGRNPAGLLFAAGVISKGDGDCFLTPEVHTSITSGGGQAGQGYPCVLTAGFCGNASAEARGIGYQSECSPTIKTGTAPSVLCLNDQGGSQMHCTEDITGTLRAQEHGHQPLVMATQQGGAEIGVGICPTITASAGMSGNNQPVLFDNHAKDCRYNGPLEVAPTVTSTYGTGGNNVPLVGSAILQETICIAGNTIDREPENGGNGLGCQPDISYTITTSDRHAVFSRQRSDEFSENDVVATQSARQHKDATDLICQPEVFGQSQYGNYAEGCTTLRAQGGDNGGGSENLVKENGRNLIRRLTPLECERLQGFPDGWTLIPGASDSARYKALGNSVAIPCVDFVLRGIAYFLRIIHEEQEESPPCISTPTT